MGGEKQKWALPKRKRRRAGPYIEGGKRKHMEH